MKKLPKQVTKDLVLSVKLPKESPESKDYDAKYLKEVESFVKKHLRRVSLQWPARSEAVKLARKSRGFYECSECKTLVGPKQYNLDHIEPVQPIGREIDLITWIYRLLIPVEQWQLLCVPCHDTKTDAENMLRDIRRQNNRKKK